MQGTVATETSLALIQKDVLYMRAGIDEVKLGIKEINARFATKDEVDNRIKLIEKDAFTEIKQLKEKVGYLEKAVLGAIAFVLYQVGVIIFNVVTKI